MELRLRFYGFDLFKFDRYFDFRELFELSNKKFIFFNFVFKINNLKIRDVTVSLTAIVDANSKYVRCYLAMMCRL